MARPTKSADSGPSRSFASDLRVRRVVVGQWGRIYAEALKRSCLKAFPKAEIEVSCTGVEILATLDAGRADLLLLAMILPDMHGADVLRRVTQRKLAARVLVASHCRDERTLLALRSAHYDGLIDTQQESTRTLIKALRLVASGQSFVSSSFRGTTSDLSPDGVVWRQLTRAEIRVFAAIGDGSANDEAARHLGLSEATVQTHRRNLMHKLGVFSSAKLVREAIRLGVVRIMPDGKVIRVEFPDKPVGEEPAELLDLVRT